MSNLEEWEFEKSWKDFDLKTEEREGKGSEGPKLM